MRWAAWWVLIAATATGCECGDNQGFPVDAGKIKPDARPVDAGPDAPPAVRCEIPAVGAVGGLCAGDETCSLDGSAEGMTAACLDDSLNVPWPATGFCTTFECADSSDCPAGNVCAQLPFDGVTFGTCLPECCEQVEVGQVCSPGRMCSDQMFGDPIGVAACVPATPGAGDGDPCSTFAACAINSTCRDDSFQHPGGQCAVLGCTDDDDCAPAGDGRCVNLTEDQVGNVCVDDCDTDDDCRTAEGYRCVDHGGVLGKFCRHPAPGDDCAAAADCGTGAANDPWSCRTDNGTNSYPGGYCTVGGCDPANNDTCPIFSFCVELAGEGDTFCADECAPGGDGCGTGYDCVEIDAPGEGTEFVCLPTGATVSRP